MSSSEQTINIPQLLIIIIVGAVAVRYFLFPSNANPGAQNRSATNNVRAREADVERIQQMFPQVSRRNIMWDLQRNGGNVVATTERILSGRGLEVPPQSFQPPLPVPPTSAATPSSSQTKPAPPDLITRYNLKGKVAEEDSRPEGAESDLPSDSGGNQKQGQAWSTNKVERQAILQKRRDEMILTARRKLLAKEQEGKKKP